MKILYLCLKNTFDTKMSRVRFEGMAAIAKQADVIYSGNGWENYDSEKTVDENIKILYGDDKPDLIVAYKPENFKGIAESSVPRCIRYNEMWPVSQWTNELSENNINLCIAHHLNDIPKYDHIKNVCFSHVPHSAEASIYKDYGENKVYDILLTGAMGHKHYPFRTRLQSLLPLCRDRGLNVKNLQHCGSRLNSINGFTGEGYARQLNKAKITITCSSAYKYRLGKYVEIPMCGSLLAADLPGQDHDQFKEFMLVLNPNSSDDDIVNQLYYYSTHDDDREALIQKGFEWSARYTQEKYAQRFLIAAEAFLEEWNDGKWQ